MSLTTIYPPIGKSEAREKLISNIINEQTWVIDEIIIPKLPSLLATIKLVLLYLLMDKTFKLPIASNSSEHVKGTVSRSSYKITGLNLLINKLSHFNNLNPHKMSLEQGQEIELVQIKQCVRNLGFLGLQLKSLMEFSETQQKNRLQYNVRFLKKFNQIYQGIQMISEQIDKPAAELLFPENHLRSEIFEPALDLDKMSIDLFLNGGEIYLELVFLKKISVKPWCFINRYGISFNEFLHQKMIQNRKYTIIQLAEHYMDERNWAEFWLYDGNQVTEIHIDHEKHNLASWFLPKWTESNQMYLNKNMKFNGGIYWVLKDVQIKIGDPILIIVNIKLNSIKGMVQNNLVNLRNLVVSQDFLHAVTEKESVFLKMDEESYNELLNEFFSNTNTDLAQDAFDFDLESFLAEKGSEDDGSLEINLKLLKELDWDFKSQLESVQKWDDDFIKEISGMVNEGESFADSYSCCEYDVLD